MRFSLRPLLFCAAASVAAPACGDNGAPSTDASVPRNDQLSVLNPPGDAIGLDFSGSITLRVQLTDSEGQAIAGQPIEFSLLQTGDESAGGSSLSDTSRTTNSIGIAEVDLVAGAQRVNFRVEASTPNAPSVLFYIQVSDQGFSDVSIVSAHEGPRDPASYDRVELRIYDDRDVDCPNVDFQQPPESLFPPRTQESLGDQSEFRNLAVGLGYTVIAWAEAGPLATPQATGCLHIAADRLRSGTAFGAVLPVTDSPFKLATPLQLTTDIALGPLAESLTGAAAWATLACPLGRAQLLLDCLPDAQAPDADLDCNALTSSALQDALEARRGPVGADGCRPATLGNGDDSLDATLSGVLEGWPSAQEREALYGGRDLVLGTLRVRSELASSGLALARHRLLRAELDSFGLDLGTTAAPILEVPAVAMALGASPSLGLAAHDFTLRYGDIAALAYEELALAPANVSMLGETLGDELVEGIAIAAQTGCPAIESFVCTELSLAGSCADQCSSIASSLNALLGDWIAEVQSTGLDYHFGLNATLVDSDVDLVIDALSAQGADALVELTTQVDTFPLEATVDGSVP